MPRLSQKAANRIASLINSMTVGATMSSDAEREGDRAKLQRWKLSTAQAGVELADEFGIELPCLDLYRLRVERKGE